MKRLLLVGGGHAHLEVLRQFALPREWGKGVECVLASPNANTLYSGMLPGVIAGHYRLADAQIDLARLAQNAGWCFLPQALQSLNAEQRVALLAGGERVPYDVLSLDTGSVADLTHIEGGADQVIPLRPFPAFLASWNGMLAQAIAGKLASIAVVGAGAAGVEIILAMAYSLSNAGGGARACKLLLVSEADTILTMHAPGVQKKFGRILASRGIAVHCASRVRRIAAGAMHTEQGTVIEAERVVWAVAGTAPDWPKAAGLAVDAHGFVAIDPCLRSLSHRAVFGGGDIVTLSAQPHPKSGVYAVRHGPVLAANLHAAIRGGALRAFTPQRHALSLISEGEKSAVASWARWSLAGNWVWNWKDRIDRGFVAKYGGHAL